MNNDVICKTVIDTLGIRIECNSAMEQRELLDNLLCYIKDHHPFYIDYKDNVINQLTDSFNREYYIYGSSKLLACITTMCFQVGKNRNQTVYFIKIVWAGLKKYNELTDNLSLICMLSVCSWLNSINGVKFRLCELDVAIDVRDYLNNVLILPLNRVPNVDYYRLDEEQPFEETTYIEKINIKRKEHLSSRAYLYNKNYREQLEDEVITRFEVALKTAFFKNKSTNLLEILSSIYKTLNRYAILHFSDLYEKESMIQEYNGIIDSDIKNKSRKLNSLHLTPIRLFHNFGFIEKFLSTVLFIKDFHLNMGEDWFVDLMLSKLDN